EISAIAQYRAEPVKLAAQARLATHLGSSMSRTAPRMARSRRTAARIWRSSSGSDPTRVPDSFALIRSSCSRIRARIWSRDAVLAITRELLAPRSRGMRTSIAGSLWFVVPTTHGRYGRLRRPMAAAGLRRETGRRDGRGGASHRGHEGGGASAQRFRLEEGRYHVH